MDYAKLKAKAAFYTTYVNELEKQDKDKEPFNNRDFINTVRDERIIKSDLGFNKEETDAIIKLIYLGVDNVCMDSGTSNGKLESARHFDDKVESGSRIVSSYDDYLHLNGCFMRGLIEEIWDNTNDR